MSFIRVPYLPDKKVTVAVGDREQAGVRVIKPYRITCLPQSMQHHADLSFCYLGGGVAVCAPEAYDYYKKQLAFTSIELIKGEKEVGSNYPLDAAYNVAIVGGVLYCKKAICDGVLLKVAQSMGYEIVNINQGYGKCSVCPVDENSAISADMSFFKAATKKGVEVLLTTNEGISLPGFENGFFGGCAYMTDKNTLCIKGDGKTLPSYEKITEFLKIRGISISEGKGAVTDFGSFIPIMEE
ncbi:MAG: hypothetical protein IJO83_01335 [Clostridia bacterium]|nr:hypothetical protein [Clostridia bacterium]